VPTFALKSFLMKKFLFLLILLTGISTLTLVAQPPTITSAINPQVGTIVFNNVYVDSVYPAGPSGANQSWDFSTLPTDFSTKTWYMSDTAVTDSTTQYPQDFPFANIASYTRDTSSPGGDSTFVYSNVSAAQYVNWGQENSSGKVVYLHGEIMFTYPFNYNQTLVDTLAGTVVNQSGTFNRTGIETITADGYGTLTMPQGSFYNTLRLNRKENFTDSGTLGGDGSYRYANQSYEWYSGTFGYNLLTINFDTLFYTLLDSAYVYPSYSVTYGLEAASGVKNITSSFSLSVFPNPATEKVAVVADEVINRITVSNLLGQTIIDLREEYNAPGNPVEISVADLPAGIYMCGVTTPMGTLTRKVVKQ
jgi:hypothetical protein